MNKFILSIALAVSILGFISQAVRISNNSNQQSSVTPTPTPIQIPDGWKEYKDAALGVSFWTPQNFTTDQNGQYSVMAKDPKSQAKVGDVQFFYVSVVPNSLKSSQTAEVYNYSSTFHQKLLNIQPGQTGNLSVIESQKDWYEYQRLPDEIIDGKTAKVYLNKRPWEFPRGTWEYRYIFDSKDKIILVGAYIVGESNNSPLNLETVKKIISTLTVAN